MAVRDMRSQGAEDIGRRGFVKVEDPLHRDEVRALLGSFLPEAQLDGKKGP
jgi:hypothetical protein